MFGQELQVQYCVSVVSYFAVIVSFIWGAAIFQEEIGNLALTLVGLGILFLGIAGISISGTNLLAEEKAGRLVTTTYCLYSQDMKMNPWWNLPVVKATRLLAMR